MIEGAHQPKLYKILPWLYLGSQDAAVNEEGLQLACVTQILNVATGIENRWPERFEYLSVPLLDTDEADLHLVLPACLSFLDDAKERSEGSKRATHGESNSAVLVHCNAGVSRSTSVVLAYLITRLHLGYDEALSFVKDRKPDVRPNAGFARQLKELMLPHHNQQIQ